MGRLAHLVVVVVAVVSSADMVAVVALAQSRS
jgi:hypothetical protein